MVTDIPLPMFKLPLKYAAATKAKSGFSLVELLIVTAILLLLSIVYLKKFMRDMALVEDELIKELKEMKGWLIKISEKQL